MIRMHFILTLFAGHTTAQNPRTSHARWPERNDLQLVCAPLQGVETESVRVLQSQKRFMFSFVCNYILAMLK